MVLCSRESERGIDAGRHSLARRRRVVGEQGRVPAPTASSRSEGSVTPDARSSSEAGVS